MAAAYLKNRTPHKALKMETPFKMLRGEEVDLSHILVIGARTFVHIKDCLQSSLRFKIWYRRRGMPTTTLWTTTTFHTTTNCRM